MKGSLCVRKGAWSKVEDDLLAACVRQHGEGKWHLVPTRAGLNRCRKSCRLRWLNYLKPSIKRGKFSEDEVDMMKRLHRLLGNRWSLIAGRLPGRTSNDVKNYWNTHLSNKKLPSHNKEKITNAKAKEIVKPNKVIKPQPWTFTSTLPPPWLKTMFLRDDQSGVKQCPTKSCAPLIINDNCINVMEDKVENPKNDKCCLDVQDDGMLIKDFNDDGKLTLDCLLEDQSWNDFLVDFNFEDL